MSASHARRGAYASGGSWKSLTVVTPAAMYRLAICGSSAGRALGVQCVCRSNSPGSSAWPWASTTRAPFGAASACPAPAMAAMRPSRTSTLPGYAGRPVPSNTMAPRISSALSAEVAATLACPVDSRSAVSKASARVRRGFMFMGSIQSHCMECAACGALSGVRRRTTLPCCSTTSPRLRATLRAKPSGSLAEYRPTMRRLPTTGSSMTMRVSL